VRRTARPGRFDRQIWPRNTDVIAAESATCLVLTPGQPTLFEGRGEGAHLVTRGPRVDADVEDGSGTTLWLNAEEFLQAKLQALAAYRSQFPIRPDMLPEEVFRDLFGAEYFQA
jgi:hypothetical protein